VASPGQCERKYIEEGNHGEGGADAHKAAVPADTVGDLTGHRRSGGEPDVKITNIVRCCGLADPGGWLK